MYECFIAGMFPPAGHHYLTVESALGLPSPYFF
jgi:hypothetical protein